MFELGIFICNELRKRGFEEIEESKITIDQIARDIANFISKRGGVFTPKNVLDIQNRGETYIETGEERGLLLTIAKDGVEVKNGFSEGIKFVNSFVDEILVAYYYYTDPEKGLILGEYNPNGSIIDFDYYNADSVNFAKDIIRTKSSQKFITVDDVQKVVNDRNNGIYPDGEVDYSDECNLSDVIDSAIKYLWYGEKRTR